MKYISEYDIRNKINSTDQACFLDPADKPYMLTVSEMQYLLNIITQLRADVDRLKHDMDLMGLP